MGENAYCFCRDQHSSAMHKLLFQRGEPQLRRRADEASTLKVTWRRRSNHMGASPGANRVHGHLLLPCALPGECCEAEASGFPSGHQQHLQGRPEEPEDEVPKVVPAVAKSLIRNKSRQGWGGMVCVCVQSCLTLQPHGL